MKWLLIWTGITGLTIFLAVHTMSNFLMYYIGALSLLQICMLYFMYEEGKKLQKLVGTSFSAHMKTWDKITELYESNANVLSSLNNLVSYNETDAETVLEIKNTVTALKRQNTMLNERMIALAKDHEETHGRKHRG